MNPFHRAAAKGHNHICVKLIQEIKYDPKVPTKTGKGLQELVTSDVWNELLITLGPYLMTTKGDLLKEDDQEIEEASTVAD